MHALRYNCTIKPMCKSQTTILLIAAAVLSTLNGCAKFPTGPTTTGKQLVVTLKVRGRINPLDPAEPNIQRHYFVAIDNDNDPNTGPLAALYPPYGGTGWVTSQNAAQSVGLTSFVQYDAANPQGYIYGVLPGSFFLNRTAPQPPIGYEMLDGGSSLRFVIDFSQIATATIPADQIKQLNINFITTNALPNGNDLVESRADRRPRAVRPGLREHRHHHGPRLHRYRHRRAQSDRHRSRPGHRLMDNRGSDGQFSVGSRSVSENAKRQIRRLRSECQ